MQRFIRCSRWFPPLENLTTYRSRRYFSTISTHPEEPHPTPFSPPPIRVAFTQSSGRGVFTTRRIGAGELIHTARAIISHPSLSSSNSVCYLCLRRLQDGAAHTDPVASFCNAECKAQSEAFYDVEKKAHLSAFNDYCRARGLKYPLLVKRLACMVISRMASLNILDILQPALLSPEMLLLMEEEFGLLRSAFRNTDFTDENLAFLTKQWYIRVLARIRINAFRVELAGGFYEDLLSSASAEIEAEGAVGNAIYMLPSFYNHNCDPNAHIIWVENVDAKLKALRDIEEGEELQICYIDASMDRDARQNLLLQGFGFECQCLRCLSNE